MSFRERLMEWLDRFEPHKDEVRAAIVESLPALTAGRTDIVGVGVMTDSDVGTLVPVALTAGKRASNAENFPELADYLDFVPDEWDLIGGGGTAMERVASAMRPLGEDVPDGDAFLTYRSAKTSWLLEIMKELRLEGWFEENWPGAAVTFWETDTDTHPQNVIEHMELLNPPDRVEGFSTHVLFNGL